MFLAREKEQPPFLEVGGHGDKAWPQRIFLLQGKRFQRTPGGGGGGGPPCCTGCFLPQRQISARGAAQPRGVPARNWGLAGRVWLCLLVPLLTALVFRLFPAPRAALPAGVPGLCCPPPRIEAFVVCPCLSLGSPDRHSVAGGREAGLRAGISCFYSLFSSN